MGRVSRMWRWMALLLIVLGAAACGNDDDKPAITPEPTAETGSSSGSMSLEGGLGLNVGAGGGIAGGLPGCTDPDDEECPLPLVMDLDGEIAVGGVSVRYPDRYFDATLPRPRGFAGSPSRIRSDSSCTRRGRHARPSAASRIIAN